MGFGRLRSTVSGLGREAMLRARMATAKGDAGSILFFPSYWRVQSSLLRVDHVAERLAERGWRTAIARPDFDLARRRRLLEAMSPDVLFIHLARNEHHDPALYPGRRVVFDMDDADWLNPRFAERVEACVAGAAGVIAGSRHLRRWCDEHGAKRSTVVWTGTPPSEGPRPAHEDRAPIVTWAQSDPANYPEELAFVEDVMTRVAARRPGVRLRLYGWRQRYDASLTAGMERAGVAVEKVAPLPYADFLRSLRETAVGLSPVIEANPYSRGKSFGKILAYFDAEVPVVTSDAVDHPLLFTHENGVMSGDPAVWAAEIEALLADPTRRAAMGRAGFETMRARLSSDAAATRVEAFLKEVIAATP